MAAHNGEPRMLTEARHQADARAASEHRPMVVYYTTRDRYGRDAVWYVRAADEERPYDDYAQRPAEVVYRTAQRPAERRAHHWRVTVGNIGEVSAGASEAESRLTFAEYAQQSRQDYGRAAGESVTLCKDDEPILTWHGTVDAEAD